MSTTTLTTSTYDYAALPEADRTFVQETTEAIRHNARGIGRAAWEIGKDLAAVKARLPHGRWLPWLEPEFPSWGARTAQRFIAVYEAFGSNTTPVSHLDDAFDQSALMLLAAPSVPQEARDEAVAEAKAGRKVTKSRARAIVARHTPSKPSKPAEPPGIGQELARLNASLSPARVVVARDDVDQQLVRTHAGDLLRKLQVLAGGSVSVVATECETDDPGIVEPPAGLEHWLQSISPLEIAKTIMRVCGMEQAYLVSSALLRLVD
jgi:hypothetical protein